MPKHLKEIQANESKWIYKIRNVMFFILCICIIFVIIFYVCDKLKEKKPKAVINKFFTAIKENNKQLANEFSNYEELIDSFDTLILQNDGNTLNLEKELFKNIIWNIDDVKIENNNAIVIVEVTNKNFKNIITKWMEEIVISKSVGEDITDEMALQKLEKILLQESEYKTGIKKITLKNEGEKWKIQVNEDLRDLVYPGIDSIIEVLNSI